MSVIYIFRYWLLLALALGSSACLAGVQVGATRVIFPASDREASVQVRNEGAEDTMIQSWIEAAPGQPESAIPFAITPSLSRLSHKKQQMLRIFYQGKGLPEDRESVFWLSIQEIPQLSESDNSLQVAVRQRLKLFYRPVSLSGTPDEAAENIKWKLLGNAGESMLLADNVSAFHVSFGDVKVLLDGREYSVESQMLTPANAVKMKVKGLSSGAAGHAKVMWESINDYGAVVKHQTPVQF